MTRTPPASLGAVHRFFRCPDCRLPHSVEDGSVCPITGRVVERPDLPRQSSVAPARKVLAGRYRLEQTIGEGGMGVVWAAHDEHTDRRVAVKLMHLEAATPDVRKRFLREARAMAGINDAGVLNVYDFGEDEDGAPYLVTELLGGETVAQRLYRQGKFDVQTTVDIVIELLLTLSNVHQAGLIHRDIKPGNVFLTMQNGEELTVRLLDFGLTRPVIPQTRITEDGEVLGTPGYMPPEQLLGQEISASTDLYAVGALMYEMLSGRCPFELSDYETVADFVTAVLTRAPTPLSSLVPVTPLLNDVIMRAILQDPSARPASAREMLDDVLDGLPQDFTRSGARSLPPPAFAAG